MRKKMSRQSEPLSFEMLFQSLNDPMFICDSNLRILQVNEAFSMLFEDNGGPVVGKLCHELFADKCGEDFASRFNTVFLTKTAQSWDISFPMTDGTLGSYEFIVSPLSHSDGSITKVIGHAHDISKRKNLEKELKVSDERYRKIVETAREGIYIVDSEARITFANKQLSMMLGYRPDELLGKCILDCMAEDSEALARAKFQRRRMGLSDTFEIKLTRKDRSSIHCLVSASPIVEDGVFQGALAILTNITCLKEIEAALLSAKTFSERIINSITDKLMVIDPSTYRIVQVNDHFLDRTMFQNAEELFGRTCYEVLFDRSVPCHEAGIFCPVRKTYETGQPLVCDDIHPELMESGRVKQIATYPIMDNGGKVDLVIRTERDVTEKTNLEQALALRSEQLLRTQRRLEELFDLSREVGTKATLPELVEFLLEFTVKLLPGLEPAFLLLNSSCEQFLRLEDCEPKYVEKLLRILQKLELSTLSSELVHQIKKCRPRDLIGPSEKSRVFSLLKIVADSEPTWSAIPLFVRRQCIGLLFLGSKTFNRYSPEDIRFLEALCEQASGHLRNLVMHETEVKNLKSQVTQRSGYGDIIGQSKIMQEVYELIDLVSSSDATVLITGENGTGKELVANAIHKQSHRRKGPFVVANCSAYSPTLLESEIFGHEKGAFTGATHQKKGRIERANGGTLFLDEIGEIAPSVQIFLLRFLQDHCFERVGGEKVISVDVRVLAATNRDLHHEVQAGRFRDDLFYRLNVIAIHLPSLRERKEDIPLLAHHFLAKHNLKERKNIHSISSDAMQALLDHDWPGNVRQLENAISHAVVLTHGELIRRKHLPRFLWEIGSSRTLTSLSETERGLILEALQRSNWNKHEAARRLKISRSTLYSKMRRYELVEESNVRCLEGH
ncbi:MAG: sigma 54-interacting transcriptional regulator [Syntrophobacteraceae bacterium]